MNDQLPITVVMITFNEAFHLEAAIENVKDWAQAIMIVDSGSTDGTVDIALKHGVTIVQRPFTNFGDQWHFATQQMPITTEWTLKMDPDERLTPELKDEIRSRLQSDCPDDSYRCRFRLWFMGRPLHAFFSPVLRLWRTGTCHFSNVEVNEHPLVEGTEGLLQAPIDHLDSEHLHHWFEKQNHYATLEALRRYRHTQLADTPKLFGTWLQRRMWLKKIFFQLPMRYQLLYLYQLIVCGVWRDGQVGRIWARLRVEIVRMQEYKWLEMQWTGQAHMPTQSRRSFTLHPRLKNNPLQQQLLPPESPQKTPVPGIPAAGIPAAETSAASSNPTTSSHAA